tara:strand:- start:93 stop:281 length:189 start_codon:yes stop_codon:yes gene_type:complete
MGWTNIMNMSKREINNKLNEKISPEVKVTIILTNDATGDDLKRVGRKLDELKYCIKDIKVSR